MRAGLLAAAALVLAGCGSKTIDEGQVERQIADNYARGVNARPTVDCPGGEDAKKGNRFECTASIGSTKATVEVTMIDDRRFTFRAKP